jgi:drug/metabolite transporter (DMT)-like permease
VNVLTVLPLLTALLAAAFFGGSVLLARQGLRYVDAQTGSMISIMATTAIYSCMAPFFVKAEYFLSPGIWVFAASGCIHPLISQAMSFEATRRVGATVSSTVSSTSPLFSSGAAVLLLGERPSWTAVAGTLATVGGAMVLTSRGKAPRGYALGSLMFAFAAAAIRGTNFLTGKVGLQLLPVPFMAAWISFLVSCIGSILFFRVRKGHLPLSLPRGGLKWFGLTGIFISTAIFCMYFALGQGSVVTVAPIVAAFPLFTLLLTLLLRQEAPSWRVILGTVIVVAGVILVSV